MKLIIKALAAAAALAACGASMAQVTYDANVELNNIYTNKDSGNTLDNNGRLEFNLNGKATQGEYFAAGRASLLLKLDGTTGVDDMWAQVGNKMWDAKIGRFEAMDLFPLGKDTVVATRATNYNAGSLRGRFSAGQMHVALGFNAAPGLRAELGLVAGRGDGKVNGLRPAVSYTTGPLTVRAAIESGKTSASTKAGSCSMQPTAANPLLGEVVCTPATTKASSSSTGFGLSLGYNLAPGTDANVNFAKVSSTKSFGANVTAGALGLGFVYDHTSSTDKGMAVYTAYSLPLMDVKGASITPAISYGRVTAGSTSTNQVAANLRLNYAF